MHGHKAHTGRGDESDIEVTVIYKVRILSLRRNEASDDDDTQSWRQVAERSEHVQLPLETRMRWTTCRWHDQRPCSRRKHT